MSLRIVLMRSGGSCEDPYYDALRHLGLVCCIPTLDFTFINIDQLKCALDAPHLWSGIVFTSQRAVEPVCAHLCDAGQLQWKSKPCFVVGMATHQAASQAGFMCKGGDCGSASALGPLIKQHFGPENRLPLLFVCGEMRMNTLPEFMEENGIPHKELVVYKTVAHAELREQIESFVGVHGGPTHLIYFSPSGFRFSDHLWRKALGERIRNIQHVAIGKTTGAEMSVSHAMIRIAAKPTPAAVYDAITSCP